MESGKYRIIAKCFEGAVLFGYVIQNSDGRTLTVNENDTIKLARSNKLENATYMMDIEGNPVLKLDTGLGSLETTYRNQDIGLRLTCRILDKSGKCIGYKATDKSNKGYNLSCKKTWELAYNKAVDGIKAAVIGNKKVLMSTGSTKLEDLPVLKQ